MDNAEPGRARRQALLADIGGEPYAFPLAAIARTLRIDGGVVRRLEGREHIELDGRSIGLIAGWQVFGVEAAAAAGAELSIIVLSTETRLYGLVVDRFRGERELVVQPLDRRLRHVGGISAGAVMEDGSPVLIVDAEDALTSIDWCIADGRLSHVARPGAAEAGRQRKRVLVVDDSLTAEVLPLAAIPARLVALVSERASRLPHASCQRS